MTDLLTGHEPPVTLADMIVEVERELAMRARVFPRMIENGKLTRSRADIYVRRLEAVRAHLVKPGENGP